MSAQIPPFVIAAPAVIQSFVHAAECIFLDRRWYGDDKLMDCFQ